MNRSIDTLARLGAVAILAASAFATPAQAQKKAPDAGAASSEPFRLKRFPGMSEGAFRSEQQVYTVPAGKRLVITDTYLGMTVPAGQGVVAILAACAPVIDVVNGTCHLHHIVMTPQPDGGSSSLTHAASHNGNIVVDAEETLIVSFSRGQNTGIASGSYSLIGRLEGAN